MIEITSIFTSQSPAWIAATFHGTFSQIIDPVSRITGNPIHRKSPSKLHSSSGDPRACARGQWRGLTVQFALS